MLVKCELLLLYTSSILVLQSWMHVRKWRVYTQEVTIQHSQDNTLALLFVMCVLACIYKTQQVLSSKKYKKDYILLEDAYDLPRVTSVLAIRQYASRPKRAPNYVGFKTFYCVVEAIIAATGLHCLRSSVLFLHQRGNTLTEYDLVELCIIPIGVGFFVISLAVLHITQAMLTVTQGDTTLRQPSLPRNQFRNRQEKATTPYISTL